MDNKKDKWEIDIGKDYTDCVIKVNGERLQMVQSLKFWPGTRPPEDDHIPRGLNRIDLSIFVADERLKVNGKNRRSDTLIEVSVSKNEKVKTHHEDILIKTSEEKNNCC